jgi:SET domain-containing protein
MDSKRPIFSGTGVSPVRIETRFNSICRQDADSTISESHGRDARATIVVFKPSPIHGTGGFARENIAAGSRIIEYLGEKITKQQSLARCERSNEYIFAIDDTHDLNGNVSWNPARFLNHSCEPNCEAQFVDGRIWIIASRDIRAGDELTFNYSYDLEDYREHPCQCGAKSCVGFMVAEEFFDHVRRQRIRNNA